MRRALIAIGGAALLALVAIPVTIVVAVRTQNRRILDALNRVNRDVFNPHQLKTAGQPGANAAALHHRGRVSGRDHVTPLGVLRAEEGFVIALPYGPGTDWLRNLKAAGSAVLEYEGDSYIVDDPQVVPIESTAFATTEAATVRLFGLRSALTLRARRQ